MRFFLEDNGHELPNARWASTVIHGHPNEDLEDSKMSLMVMQFGQFLDHDITLTAEADMCHQCGEEPANCCDYFLQRKNYTAEQMPDSCWPIPISQNDPVFVGKSFFGSSKRVVCISIWILDHGYLIKFNQCFY